MSWHLHPEFRAAKAARDTAAAALVAATAGNPAPGTPDWWAYQGAVVDPARLNLTRAVAHMHATRKQLLEAR